MYVHVCMYVYALMHTRTRVGDDDDDDDDLLILVEGARLFFCFKLSLSLSRTLTSYPCVFSPLRAVCIMHAHKVVLTSRCEYFRTIFQSGFLEQSTGVIPITGVSPQTFELVLRYIYTGDDSMSKDPDHAVEILLAAG
jgi:BTB/POZ domain